MQGQADASKGRIPSLPLAGFHLTNCFDLVVPDTLHTLHSGVGSYICNFNLKSASLLKTCMEMSGKHQANLLSKMSASIDESSPLREYSLPSVKFELPTDKNITVSSEQAANLCRLALVACLVDDALRPVVDVLQGTVCVSLCILISTKLLLLFLMCSVFRTRSTYTV